MIDNNNDCFQPALDIDLPSVSPVYSTIDSALDSAINSTIDSLTDDSAIDSLIKSATTNFLTGVGEWAWGM